MAFFPQHSDFIQDLLKVLGLDHREVIGFILRAYVDEIVTIQVQSFAQIDDKREIVLKKYKITKEEIIDV